MRRSRKSFSWLLELGITSQQSRQKKFKQAPFSLTIKYELLALILQCSLFLWSVQPPTPHTWGTPALEVFYGCWIPPATWGNLPPHTRILTVSSACVDLCVCVCWPPRGCDDSVSMHSHMLRYPFRHIHCSVSTSTHCEQVWILEAMYYSDRGMLYRLSDYKPVLALRDYFNVPLPDITKRVTCTTFIFQHNDWRLWTMKDFVLLKDVKRWAWFNATFIYLWSASSLNEPCVPNM